MRVCLYANGEKFCEDYEYICGWEPKTPTFTHYYFGQCRSGQLHLPENVHGVAGTKYDFCLDVPEEGMRYKFTGWYDKTVDDENYIQIVWDIKEELL